MSEIVGYYYERFKGLGETARLLIVVSLLGICSLYVLGVVALIAGPRLRQAPIAYAEAILLITPTPIDTATPEATPTPTWTPTQTPRPTTTVALTFVEAPTPPAVDVTPTQHSIAPVAVPTEPKLEPSPTRKPPPTATPKGKAKPTATPTGRPRRS